MSVFTRQSAPQQHPQRSWRAASRVVGAVLIVLFTLLGLIHVQPLNAHAHSMMHSKSQRSTVAHSMSQSKSHPLGQLKSGRSGGGSVDGDLINAEVRYGDAADRAGDGALCEWSQFSGVDPVAGKLREQTTTRVRNGIREVLYSRICGTSITQHWIPEQTTRRISESAENRATDVIPRLITQTAPPIDAQVVNVGTWFWVPRSLWKTVSVTAFVVTSTGTLTATVTATPTHLIYSPGDGTEPVVCEGPGAVWRSWMGDDASSPCMYTPRVASHVRASGTYKAKISVRWAITLKTNFGVRTRLPNAQFGLTHSARVLEMQALTR